jgi:cell division protein FtsB
LTGSDVSGGTGSFRPVLVASVLLFLTVLGIAGVKSSHDLEAARQRKLLLETRIQVAETDIGRLQNRIERLRSDPGLLERLAREDLGMVRPGDVVIELPIEGAADAPAVVVPALPSPLPSPAGGTTAKASAPGVPAAESPTPAAGSAGPPAPPPPAPAPVLPAAAPPAPGPP